MGFLDKLMKKKERPQDEDWPGAGTNAAADISAPFSGSGNYGKEVAAHFNGLFPGRETVVMDEALSGPICIHIMKPEKENPYYVLFTSGLSSFPMTEKEAFGADLQGTRAELFMFMPEDWTPNFDEPGAEETVWEGNWPIYKMRLLSALPQETRCRLSYGTSYPSGDEFAPLCQETELGGLILSQLQGELGTFTAEDGTKIDLLMMLPAYKEEILYKEKYGMRSLDRIYEEGKLPLITDLHRPNLCAGFQGEGRKIPAMIKENH